jgi:hypothetical protein
VLIKVWFGLQTCRRAQDYLWFYVVSWKEKGIYCVNILLNRLICSNGVTQCTFCCVEQSGFPNPSFVMNFHIT